MWRLEVRELVMTASKSPTLAGLGFRAQPASGRELSNTLLTCAIVCIALVAIGVGTVFASYEGQDLRGAARAPLRTATGEAHIDYGLALDRLGSKSLQFTVVYIDVHGAEADPPPGVTRLPQDGEAVISPALRREGAADGIDTRFGVVAGEIGPDGLTHPDEFLVYVNPVEGSIRSDAMRGIAGFGSDRPILIGSLLDRPPIATPLIALCGIVGIPVLLLAATSLRLGLVARRQQSATLIILGATRLERVRWHFGKLHRPILYSIGIIAVVLACMTQWGLRLPLVGFAIPSADFRRSAGLLIGLALGTVATYIVMWLALSSGQAQRKPLDDPPIASETYSMRRARLCVVAASLAVLLGALASGQNSVAAFGVCLVLAAIVFATVKDLVGFLMVAIAKRARGRAQRNNDPEALVSAAILETRATSVTRLGVIVLFTVVLSCILFTVLSIFAQADPLEESTYDHFSNSVLEVSFGSADRSSAVQSVIEKAPDYAADAVVDATIVDQSTGEVSQFVAIDDAQTGGDVSQRLSSERSLHDYAQYASILPQSPGTDTIRFVTVGEAFARWDAAQAAQRGDDSQSSLEVAFVAKSQGNLDVAKIKGDIAATFAPIPSIASPAENWIVAETESLARVKWVALFSVIALIVVFLALAIIVADERSDSLRRLAGMTRQAGRPIKSWKIGAFRTLLPIGLGGVLGIALSMMLSVALVLLYGESIGIFVSFIPLISIVLAILTTCLWVAVSLQFSTLAKEGDVLVARN